MMKNLSPYDVTIRPYTVNKSQLFTYTSGSSTSTNLPEVKISIASKLDHLTYTFDPTTAETNADGLYKNTLYDSVNFMLYSSGSNSSTGSTTYFTPAGGVSFTRDFALSDSLFVVHIPQSVYGEKIRRGSFKITDVAGNVGQDDGYGKIVFSSTTIGNIFYNYGIAVFNKASSVDVISTDGLTLDNGDAVTIEFDTTHTIYEYQVVATIEPNEFNFSINPTVDNPPMTGSYSSSLDMIADKVLDPYITTIGLYNDNYELVVVAKLPRAIKRSHLTTQTFVVRFDV